MDRPGIRKFQQPKNIEEQILAAAAGPGHATEGTRLKSYADILNTGSPSLIPIVPMTRNVLAAQVHEVGVRVAEFFILVEKIRA
jgi:hypothetical protein